MKILAPLAAFTVAYIIANLLLLVISSLLVSVADFHFSFSGLVAAGLASVVAGHVFARKNDRFAGDLSKLGYTVAMCAIVGVLAFLQIKTIEFFSEPTSAHRDDLPLDLILPMIAMAYFAVIRLCLSVGANASYRTKHGLTDLDIADTKTKNS